MTMKTCKHCNVEFELNSSAKRAAGGKINECADCVEELGTETAVKYTGLQHEETGSFTISRHSSAAEREAHMKRQKNGVDLSK